MFAYWPDSMLKCILLESSPLLLKKGALIYQVVGSLYVRMYVSMNVYMYVCLYVSLCVCMYICVSIYQGMYLCNVYVCVYVYI